MSKTKIGIIILLLISSIFNLSIVHSTHLIMAGSSSSGDIPPPSESGGDTGGGTAAGGLYLNYRIPLIFRTGIYGPTLISITTLENSTSIIFGFNSTLYENNSVDINMGETLILDPTIERDLANGSLIQSFAPLQINVYHKSNSIQFDDTFSYSVLAMSMWGKKYQAPFNNMRAMIVAGYNQTEIEVFTVGNPIEYSTIPVVGETLDIEAESGTIIKANGPIGIVFYSLTINEGSYSFTGIPSYLWGTEYYIYPPSSIESTPLLEGETIIILSTIEEGENIHTQTNYDNGYLIELQENSSVELPNDILESGEFYNHVISHYTNFSLALMFTYTFNGTAHKAAVEYISADKMRWAEWFFSSLDYSNIELGSIILEDESLIFPVVISGEELAIDLTNSTIKNTGDYFSYNANNSFGFIGYNGSFFSYLFTSIPEHYNWNSSANILYPLNLFTYTENTSSSFPSWYRFPNINVKEVKVSPLKPTEFRRLELDVVVQNNGTIPSAPFYVTVYVNDSLKIHTSLDGLDINQTISVIFEEFQGFGKKILNISIFTDSLSQIFELYEFDNGLEFFVEITRNWNIIFTFIAISAAVVGYIVFRICKRIINERKRRKSRFDVILSEIEV